LHGWHNNAAEDCENLQSFNQLLQRLDNQIKPPAGGAKREVMGVYIGWRGLAIDRGWDKTGIGWAARYFSFYSRKGETERVAGIPLQQTLCTLSAEAHKRGGRVVFVGHSFGARILERVTGQILVGQTALNPDKSVVPPADLTLLLNPASEAIYARRLKLALQAWPFQTPAIVSITSLGDTATGTWWPAGMNLKSSTQANAYRDYNDGPNGKYRTSQIDYVTHTAGHSDILVDRRILPLAAPGPVSAESGMMWNLEHASTGQFRAGKGWYEIVPATDENSPGHTSPPFRIDGRQAKGYWVVDAPKTIIKDHNDIFNESAIDLFAAIYRICGRVTEMPPAEKAIQLRSVEAATSAPNMKTASVTVPRQPRR
jgi:hypothetical protein